MVSFESKDVLASDEDKEDWKWKLDDVCLSPKDWDMRSMVRSLLARQISQK